MLFDEALISARDPLAWIPSRESRFPRALVCGRLDWVQIEKDGNPQCWLTKRLENSESILIVVGSAAEPATTLVVCGFEFVICCPRDEISVGVALVRRVSCCNPHVSVAGRQLCSPPFCCLSV